MLCARLSERTILACRCRRGNGGEGDRTPDLVNAIHALSQLSYAPAIFSRPAGPATDGAKESES